MEIDEVSVATYVVDGDTFDVETDEVKGRRTALVDNDLILIGVITFKDCIIEVKGDY